MNYGNSDYDVYQSLYDGDNNNYHGHVSSSQVLPSYYAHLKPLGLKLSKTPSIMNVFDKFKSQTDDSSSEKLNSTESHTDYSSPEKLNSIEHHTNGSSTEKLKAANFPALSLQIGSWTREAKHEGDLIAKCYFKKKQLVWETLNGFLKNKIEFPWSYISAIKATYEVEFEVLDIMLEKPPLFFHEVNPQPKKHTNWEQCGDFTNQHQASLIRTHRLIFEPGKLEKHYNKIIQADSKLYHISQQPFPYEANLFFSEIHFSNQPNYCYDSLPVAFPPQIPSSHDKVMEFSSVTISNSPNNITTTNTTGYYPDHHGVSSTQVDRPYYLNDELQLVASSSSVYQETPYQQIDYVYSNVNTTMEDNAGLQPLSYDAQHDYYLQQMENDLAYIEQSHQSSYDYHSSQYYNEGGNQWM